MRTDGISNAESRGHSEARGRGNEESHDTKAPGSCEENHDEAHA
jgi:hypothetical protein